MDGTTSEGVSSLIAKVCSESSWMDVCAAGRSEDGFATRKQSLALSSHMCRKQIWAFNLQPFACEMEMWFIQPGVLVHKSL